MDSKVEYTRTSRYKGTPRDTYADEVMVMEGETMSWPDGEDKTVVVKYSEEDRLDLVAYRVYNNPLLAWVLARRNSILNPRKLTPGTVLYCPSTARIYASGGVMDL